MIEIMLIDEITYVCTLLLCVPPEEDTKGDVVYSYYRIYRTIPYRERNRELVATCISEREVLRDLIWPLRTDATGEGAVK